MATTTIITKKRKENERISHYCDNLSGIHLQIQQPHSAHCLSYSNFQQNEECARVAAALPMMICSTNERQFTCAHWPQTPVGSALFNYPRMRCACILSASFSRRTTRYSTTDSSVRRCSALYSVWRAIHRYRQRKRFVFSFRIHRFDMTV